MKSPYTGKEMSLNREERPFTFRKETFTIVYHYFRCSDSDEAFTTTELDNLNMTQLYNHYRCKMNIPFTDEIIQLRKLYGLSAIKMSEVLGFGQNGYRNYENGEVPSLSNSRLIQVIKDAREFKKLIDLSNVFDGKQKSKVLNRIDQIILEQKENKFQYLLKDYLVGSPPVADNFSGYKIPDLAKFTEMIIYFADTLRPYKVKMNKLLFFADFIMYKKSGYSISGLRYVAIPMGPAPNNYNSIYDNLARKDEFDIISKVFNDGVGERFRANSNRKFNPDLFSIEELSVLTEVSKQFKNTSTQEIVEYSHTLAAWLENKKSNGVIDYKYGFSIEF